MVLVTSNSYLSFAVSDRSTQDFCLQAAVDRYVLNHKCVVPGTVPVPKCVCMPSVTMQEYIVLSRYMRTSMVLIRAARYVEV